MMARRLLRVFTDFAKSCWRYDRAVVRFARVMAAKAAKESRRCPRYDCSGYLVAEWATDESCILGDRCEKCGATWWVPRPAGGSL